MSYRYSRSYHSRYQAAVRSRVMMRNAAQDGVLGAALGLLLVAALVASNLDIRHMMGSSASPMESLGALIGVIVTQCAIAASLGGLVIRKFAAGE